MAPSFPWPAANLRWSPPLNVGWAQQLLNLTIALCLTLGIAFTAASLGGVGDALTRALATQGVQPD